MERHRQRIEIEFDATIDGAEEYYSHIGAHARASAKWNDMAERVTVSMTPVVDPPK